MSFDRIHLSLDCDGGGWTGCGSHIPRREANEPIPKMRARAKLAGWTYVRSDDGTMMDLCPRCSQTTAGL